MARPLRLEYGGAIYHLCSRGNARQNIFTSDADRDRLVHLMAESARRFDVAILAFVLMDNHFHFVTRTHRPNLAAWMQWLVASYTISFNKRHRRSGHLFQGRYKSFLVEEGEYLLSLSRYIHLNPVRGLSLGRGTPIERRRRLRDFKWSSYAGYAGLGTTFDFVEYQTVLEEMEVPKRSAKLRYRRFVEEGLLREIENPFEAVRWQAVLGSDSFVQKLRDRLNDSAPNRREIPSLRRLAQPAVEPEEILEKLAKQYNVAKQQLLARKSHRLEAKSLAMWLIWETGTKSLREIGQIFGGLDYGAVTQRIRRVRSQYDEKQKQQLFAEMLNVKT